LSGVLLDSRRVVFDEEAIHLTPQNVAIQATADASGHINIASRIGGDTVRNGICTSRAHLPSVFPETKRVILGEKKIDISRQHVAVESAVGVPDNKNIATGIGGNAMPISAAARHAELPDLGNRACVAAFIPAGGVFALR
jgi:hypothetical protein